MIGEPVQPVAASSKDHVLLRPVEPGDEAFLRELFISVREGELAPLPWTDEQKRSFLDQQFTARQRHYRSQFPGAEDCVVLVDGVPAGRLDLVRRPGEILVIDLALLPAFRGAGIGTGLLMDLLAESERTASTVHLHVEVNNPALRLYERLGFQRAAEAPPYLLMEWSATNEGVWNVGIVHR